MKAAVHTVGDAAREPDPESGTPLPYLDDFPLERQDADSVPASSPRPARRRPWWHIGLPALVAVALTGALIIVVPMFDGGTGTEPKAQPTEEAVPSLASIGDNVLLESETVLPEVECALPELGSGRQALQQFYNAELRCLDRAWKPALTEAGLSFATVAVSVVDDPETACGALPPADEATGLYCAQDATIYLPRNRTMEAFGLTEEAHLATLAHEYGHHVQHLSGLLAGANSLLNQLEAGSPPDQELGRRVELQANCFAGVFLASAEGRGSVSTNLAEASIEDFRNWIDSETHGSSETQREWASRGYRDGDAADCNTWHAASGEVS